MKINNLVKVAATGKVDNQFVGIKINNNQIEFHYPETYVLADNDDDLRKDILNILRTVSLAKTKSSDMSSYNTKHANTNVFPLGAYLWIISDYLTYGRYENREKVYERGARGKINWKKTMHSNPAISNGNVIYTEIISEKKSQTDNLLTEIYNFCVKKSVDSIGWLYGVTFDTNGIDYYRLFNEKLYINAINTEMTHTFDDGKRIRLQNMKNVILGLDEDIINTREVIYGVDSYDYVYERMVDSMFSKVDNIKEFYPSATWELEVENNVPINSSNLRPDTILIQKEVVDGKEVKKVYILDAKYYRYGTTFKVGDIPETTSIQKQITYGEYVKRMKKGEFERVYSAFIMPYSKAINIHKDRFNNDIEFIGTATAKWIDSKGETNRKIAGILVDTNFLVNNYIKKNPDNYDAIIRMIEDNIKE